jgi:hypothetical protein
MKWMVQVELKSKQRAAGRRFSTPNVESVMDRLEGTLTDAYRLANPRFRLTLKFSQPMPYRGVRPLPYVPLA